MISAAVLAALARSTRSAARAQSSLLSSYSFDGARYITDHIMAAQDRIVFAQREITGSIWLAEPQ